jgi:hypothetical protein
MGVLHCCSQQNMSIWKEGGGMGRRILQTYFHPRHQGRAMFELVLGSTAQRIGRMHTCTSSSSHMMKGDRRQIKRGSSKWIQCFDHVVNHVLFQSCQSCPVLILKISFSKLVQNADFFDLIRNWVVIICILLIGSLCNCVIGLYTMTQWLIYVTKRRRAPAQKTENNITLKVSWN